MKRLFILLLINIFAQNNGFPYWTNQIDNYTKNDYKAGSQNWQIIQHSNGWMYFGNKMGVLEFNGKDWQLYPLKNQSDVRSLKKSQDNKRIYIGGVGELGYLEPQSNGQMKYHCISSTFAPENITFGNIWNIYELHHAIYFCADQVIVKWEDEKAEFIQCPDKIDCSNLINNVLYCGTNSGIYMLAGERFYKLPNLEPLKNKKIRGVMPFQGKLLIATAQDGLFLSDDGNLTPFHTQIDDFLKKNELFSIGVNEKSIAIGTVLKGVSIINHSGEVTGYFNETQGLYNNTVLSVFFDRDNNLWLGLDNGIAYIALNNPITNLYTPPNFYGAGYAAALYNGKLYLGTNRGLFSIDWPVQLEETAPMLNLVENMKGQVWGLQKIGDDLICCLDKGLFIMEGSSIRNLNIGTGAWKCRLTLEDPNKAYVSTYNGFYLMENKKGKWQSPVFIENTHGSFINFEEESPGKLWVRNSSEEILRLSLNGSLTNLIHTDSYQLENIPYNSSIYKIGNRINLCSPKGFFHLDSLQRFIPDDFLNHLLSENDYPPFKSLYDYKGNIWALGPSIIGIYYQTSKHFFYCRHNIPLVTNFENIFPINETSTIICNENGFALWSVDTQYSSIKDAVLQIIRVDVTKPSDSLIYMNNYSEKKIIPKIAYRHNSLRFKCDLINYADKTEILFRWKMDNEPWSDFSNLNTRDYNTLGIGKHLFKVETKQMDGVIFSDQFAFLILPPWYRTNIAYSTYTLLSLIFIFSLWYWDDKRIKRKEKQVETTQKKAMQEKEDLFKKESEKKEQQIIQLKNEHLEQEVKHKNQELANTAINLARKNEALLTIKNDLGKVSDELVNTEKMNVTTVRRMILRLNNKIDENILQDGSLKKFEEHFDLVHNHFMERLSEKYPSLTLSERKMCAFVKMNLSSKEIAPLLNISLRGVETLRYRLRKKMGLNPDESLTSFINSF